MKPYRPQDLDCSHYDNTDEPFERAAILIGLALLVLALSPILAVVLLATSGTLF
jgi:hypothetical protein